MSDLPGFDDRFDPAIRVVPYDGDWPRTFEAEAQRIRQALGEGVTVEHVGSTSVPGPAAKPIVDILVLVDTLEDSWFKPALERLGYLYQPPGGGVDDDFPFFGKPAARPRQFHIHVARRTSELAASDIAVRDYLRNHPEEAAAYAALKSTIAVAHPEDRLEYIAGKDHYVRDLKARALEWVRSVQSSSGASTGLRLVPFTQDHVTQVMRLCAEEGWPTLSANAELTCRILGGPGSLALLALEDNDVVGFAFGYGDGFVQGYLSAMLVRRDRRGRGIGRALLADMFHRLHVQRLDLLSTTGAEPFYRSLPHRRMPGYRLYPLDAEKP